MCCSNKCQDDHHRAHKKECKDWFKERLFRGDGNVRKMQPMVEKELAKIKREKRERHVETVRCVLKLATLKRRIAKFEEAEVLNREAIAVLLCGDELEGVKDTQDRDGLLARALNDLGEQLRGRVLGSAACCVVEVLSILPTCFVCSRCSPRQVRRGQAQPRACGGHLGEGTGCRAP